jgi:hypothetical protein
MPYWWEDRPDERYWVEIRREEGIGISLEAPTRDELGHENAWYELVGSVVAGEVVYHYNARESRFVGRSIAAEDAVEDPDEDRYEVALRDFEPIVAPVDLAFLRNNAAAIYALRDRLRDAYGDPLYLPFQFTRDRRQLRMMSNYFARMPRELVDVLFGADGLAGDQVPSTPPAPGEDESDDADVDTGGAPGGFLDPFQAKADTEYSVRIVGGRRRRTRRHEKLVNDCAAWLAEHGREPGRNAAVDLGTKEPAVVIEAKMIGSYWPSAIREAVGQLYEYRYFKVTEPDAGLVFLASNPVPEKWMRYLEQDRSIGVMWPEGSGYRLSTRAKRYLRL